ncbi:MAG: L,D-transpeptidase, partial [Oscillospiraceae bacterium]|nr:L,D-transpeptidase [Oscillospiraceae bacterium]
GYPVSHGCVRMYTSDVQWIYNNCPIGTTVVVY